MSGSTYKVCTRCPNRPRFRKATKNRPADRTCPECSGTSYSWSYAVDVGKNPITGKRRRATEGGFPSKRDAEHAMHEAVAKSKKRRGRPAPSGKKTLRQFIVDEWLPARLMTNAASAVARHEDYLKLRVLPIIGDLPLQEITAKTLNALYAQIRDHGRTRGEGPLSPSTVLIAHQLLSKAFADAVRWGDMEYNPARDADPPSQAITSAARRAKMKVWLPAQVLAFERYLAEHAPTILVIWALASYTGLRRGEVLGLRWRDVDLDKGRLSVRQVVATVHGKSVIKEAPKSKNGFRVVDLGPKLVKLLRQRRVEQLEERLAAGPDWEDNDLVFAVPTFGRGRIPPGRWWYPGAAGRAIAKHMEACPDVPRIRPFQDLRHTHATLLLANGENPKVVQERLGHHSAAFTQDVYQHILPGMGAAAAAHFEDLIDDAGSIKDPNEAGGQ